MLYPTLRRIAGVALRWYYRDVTVEGLEHVPADGPLLVVANHPNQLVDAMLVGTALPRDVLFTGKAILMDNPAAALLLRHLPFVPLRRAQDERKRRASAAGSGQSLPAADFPLPASPDPSRNAASFAAIHDALAAGSAVLIFPEGISHHQPQLAPIKTGAARIALSARDERGVRGLHILPVGLNFEDKAEPRTRVLVRAGRPIAVDGWRAGAGDAAAVERLTTEIDEALRAVTLNFAREDHRARVLRTARLLSGIFTGPRPIVAADAPVTAAHDAARRVEAVRRAIEQAPPALRERADRFGARLDALGTALGEDDLPVEDVAIDTGVAPAARFVVREGARALAAAPLALWGRVNHWLPLRLARAIARRTSVNPEDPAMHTIVVGLVLVLLFYAVQATLVGALAGPWWALAYLATLPPSASWDFRFRDLTRRALRRVRAYLALRRAPALRARLLEEIRWLREEAIALEQATHASAEPAGAGRG